MAMGMGMVMCGVDICILYGRGSGCGCACGDVGVCICMGMGVCMGMGMGMGMGRGRSGGAAGVVRTVCAACPYPLLPPTPLCVEGGMESVPHTCRLTAGIPHPGEVSLEVLMSFGGCDGQNVPHHPDAARHE